MAGRKTKLETREEAQRREDDERRVERQRTLFVMLPVSGAVDRLKEAMLQRAYDLMCDGNTDKVDEICEWLPSKDARAMLDAWMDDQFDDEEKKSRWY